MKRSLIAVCAASVLAASSRERGHGAEGVVREADSDCCRRLGVRRATGRSRAKVTWQGGQLAKVVQTGSSWSIHRPLGLVGARVPVPCADRDRDAGQRAKPVSAKPAGTKTCGAIAVLLG